MLYGLDTSREAISKSRRALVVEGYTDCLAARQAGIHDVVAVLGTALGQKHARLLRRYADRIVVVLDGDDAGRRRADEVLEVLLAEPVDIRIARLPAGVDPCDQCLTAGPEAFEAIVEEAVDPLDYRMRETFERLPQDASDEVALNAVESVLKILSAVSPRSPLPPSQRQLRQDQILGKLSRRFGLSRNALQTRLKELSRSRRVEDATSLNEGHYIDAAELVPWDREVLSAIVAAPEEISPLLDRIAEEELTAEPAKKILRATKSLIAAEKTPNLNALLLELQAPELQGLLVQLDESICEQTHLDQNGRLHHLSEAVDRRQADKTAWQTVRTLKTSPLQPDDEAAMIEQLVSARRAAQGMTDPKEG
jgi:DNA primase